MNVLKMGIILCFLMSLSVSYPHTDGIEIIQKTDLIVLVRESGTERDENRIMIKNLSDTDAGLLTNDGIYLDISQNGGAIFSCLSNPEPHFRLFFEDKSSGYDLYPVCGDSFVIKNQDGTEFEI